MHEETRRRLLRAAFGLLCLLPTGGVFAWTLIAALPLQSRRWEQRLHDQLGVQVRVGHVSAPRPHQRYWHQVTLVDTESQETIAELPRLEATSTDQGWQWLVPQMSLRQSAVPRLWEIVQHRLLRDDAMAECVVHVAIEQLSLTDSHRPLILHNLRWTRGRRPDVQRSQLTFQLSDSSPADAVQIQLHRDRSATPPVTRLVVDTGTASLPVSLLATVCGSQWPTEARIHGRLPVDWRDGRWRASFTGQLSALNLTDLSPGWLPYPLQGTATLNVDHGTVDATGLQSIEGWLHVEQLVAPQDVVKSLIDLGLFSRGPTYAAMQVQERFAVSQFRVTFKLGPMGLVSNGVLDEAGLPVAAVDESGAVLLSDGHVRMNHLICALVPENVKNVYAARARLMQKLPATLPRF
jgi:hypothetical protein